MNKDIVVGIDFSDCSINALEHAITIANKAHSDLTMVWANHLDYSKEIFSVEPENLINEVEKRLNQLIEKYSGQMRKNNKIHYYTAKGKVYKVINNAAKEKGSFLIVIGTHGSSGFEEFWIGSNANRIVSSSNLPIITIRSGVDINHQLKTIIMPFDSTKSTRQKLPITSLLAKYFDSEIHIIGLYTSKQDDLRHRINTYVKQAEDYLKENLIRYRTLFLESDNITDTVLDYAQKVEANLISIMTEQETSTYNLWLGPFAVQMVNHSSFPVLSVHSEKYQYIV